MVRTPHSALHTLRSRRVRFVDRMYESCRTCAFPCHFQGAGTHVRAALGAGRGRLLRHLFSEMLLLCFAGCALGIGVGYGLSKLLMATELIGPVGALQWPVVFFSAGVCLCAAILVTAVPAFHVLHGRSLALRDGDRAASSGRDRNMFRRVAMTLQVAMSLVLLVGTGLMVRSFQRVSGMRSRFPRGEPVHAGISYAAEQVSET